MDRQLEIRTVMLVITVACAPALAAVLIMAASSVQDLTDLDRVAQPDGAPPVLTWSELCRDRPHALNAARAVSTSGMVVALGYMMDNDHRGRVDEGVSSFLLLPDRGNLLHPAHRLGDQMIEAHLVRGDEIPFASRRLVRVIGRLRLRRGDPAADRPLYVLEEAEAQPIDRTDIRKYLK
jgi:hypothetical protein